MLEWHKRPLYRHMGFHCKLTQQYSEHADRCVRCIPWLVRHFMGRGLDGNQGFLHWHMGQHLLFLPVHCRFLCEHLECDIFILYVNCNCYSRYCGFYFYGCLGLFRRNPDKHSRFLLHHFQCHMDGHFYGMHHNLQYDFKHMEYDI